MKLPDLPVEQPQPVQGYEKLDYALASQGHAGQVLGRAISDTALSLEHLGLAVRVGQQQVQTLKARKDFHTAGTNVLTALNKQQTITEDQLGQIYGGVDNIPQEVLKAIPGGTRTKFTSPDGTVHEEGRTDIPMYAIRAQLYRHIMQPNIDNLAKTIDEPGWSRSFALGAKLDVEQQTADVARQDAREAVAYTNMVTRNEFNDALRSGNWAAADLALKMGGQTLLPGTREQMEHEKRIAMAEWDPNEIIAGEDIQRLQDLKKGLQNVETNGGKFKVKDSLGQEDDVDTSLLTEKQRRSYVRFADAKIRQLTALNKAQGNLEQKAKLDAAYGLVNRYYEEKNIQGLRNFAADLHSSGLTQDFRGQEEKLLRVYETAAHLAEQLDPKSKTHKIPRDDFAVASLIRGVDQHARGETVTAVDPSTGKPWDFTDPDFDVTGPLLNAHGYTPTLQKELTDKLNGKQMTMSQRQQVITRVTKALGTDLEEVGKLPKDQKFNQQRQDAGANALAVGEAFDQAFAGETPTPGKVERWEKEYLAQHAERTISKPANWPMYGFNTSTGPVNIGDIPGRIRLQLQHQGTELGIPSNAEEQVVFYKSWIAPYQKYLMDAYRQKFPGQDASLSFLAESGAVIRDKVEFLKSKKMSDKDIAKWVVDHRKAP